MLFHSASRLVYESDIILAPSSCPICCGNEIVEQLQVSVYKVFRCSECHVEFLDPQPAPEILAKVYSASYFFSEREGVSETDVLRLKRRTAELYINKLLSMRDGQRGRLLEIGCGSGDFLLQARDSGFQVRGIETSEHAAATANRRLGVEVVECGEVDTVALPDGEFDVAAFSDVIEHVRDPQGFLQRVHRCLRPGGLVFIVTPSTDNWSRRLMGKRWMEYKTEHLFYFDRRSLERLLTECNFGTVQFHRNFKTLSFNYVRAHFRRYPIPIWSRALEMAGRIIPEKLARRPVKVISSGVIATASKDGAPK